MRLFFLLLISLSASSVHAVSKQESSSYKFETLLERKEVIWGFDFLPDGKVILTQRDGKMLTFDPATKAVVELKGVPKVYSAGQAGLLDVRVHPDFKTNNQIFFSYSEPVGDDESTTVLGVATLKGSELTNFKKLFSGHAPNDNDIHYGSRIEFDLKGHLFLTMGDRDQRHKAQDLAFHQGKIMRLNLDGSIPQDNPYVKQKDKKPEIWSYGHRNPQGLTRHPVTGEIWEGEMGPRGGDEINLIKPEKNYGWPVITYGREYYGPKIGTTAKAGMEQPLVHWVPSISPSAIAFYSGDKISGFKNNLFIATLSATHVRRLVMEETKVVKQEELFADLDYRWRNVRSGPDGYLYLSTDEGRFGRVVKK
ncbi:MAG: PQQ-dependent sugar dehydrogenase [Bdellovibrionales bacterium]|nr:PQQ-dependent sugar dehydrogenase [Bdellovibrionales bacterium]